MLPLTNLSNEILLLIISYLSTTTSQSVRSTLCTLAASSHRLYNLTLQYLYHDIKLCVPYGEVSSNVSHQFDLLQRSISERPGLAPLVQNLQITMWSVGQVRSWKTPPGRLRSKDDAEASGRVNEFLSKMCHLRELEFERSGDPQAMYLHFEPKYLEQNKLERLRKITISDSHMLIGDVVAYLKPRNLEAMHIKEMDTRGSISNILLQDPSHHAHYKQSLSLRTLTLGQFYFRLKTLRRLLHLCPNLKYLCFWIPSESTCRLFGLSSLSPANMPITLESVQHSLLRLELLGIRNSEWFHSDGSRIDLTSFKCLKVLTARAEFFFNAESPSAMRKGVYELLPTTLEELNVRTRITSKTGDTM